MGKKINEYFGVVVFLTICCVGAYKISTTFALNDAYWHIKTGEWICENGMVKNCIGSWVIGDKQWMAHEWLFAILIYLVSILGMRYVVLLCHAIFIFVAFICCMEAGLFKREKNPPDMYWFLAILPGFVAYASMTVARPQYISAVFVAVFIIAIKRAMDNKCFKGLYLLPFITVLWVNIHGGTAMLSYIMAGVALICLIAGFFIDDIGIIGFEKPDRKTLICFFAVLVLIVLANMVNPYGYKMLLYPYENMKDSVMLSYISEWASPDAKSFATLVLEIMPLLVGMAALIHTGRKIPAYKVALFFMFVVLFLRSERFITYLVIAQTCLIAPYAFGIKYKRSKKAVNKLNGINNCLLLLLALFEAAFVVFTVIKCDYPDNKEISDELLCIVKQDSPKRLFNHYNVGGYLLYNDIEVFIDGRYEPYAREGIMEDYLLLTKPSSYEEYEGIDGLILEYGFDALLISQTDVGLISRLEAMDGLYGLCYSDSEWRYYRSLDFYER